MSISRFCIDCVEVGPIINSRANLTDEYTVHIAGGDLGRGSAPLGETRSRYERTEQALSAQEVVGQLYADHVVGQEFTQEEFDDYLRRNSTRFGSTAVFALSVAFFEATLARTLPSRSPRLPRISLNILNGGRHAYTNPVLSDFHEFLLVPRHDDLERLLLDHSAIQARVRDALTQYATTRIDGNDVHVMGRRGNRDCVEFLLGIVDRLAMAADYDLMIDAAASQWWNGSVYQLELGERRSFSPDDLQNYWREFLRDYPVRYLEDPFAEDDLAQWRGLVGNAGQCCIVGDDVHSGNVDRIRDLLSSACMNGVVLKPDQAGTISDSLAGLAVGHEARVPRFLSHRSISTDSLVLVHLLAHNPVEFAKFGPLCSDFSAVQKINEMLRQVRAAESVSGATDASARRARG